MMKFTLFVAIFALSLEFSLGWRGFWKGRSWNGNLGDPSKNLLLASSEVDPFPPEQWFEQNLDHFDPTNNNTWKQRYWVNDQFRKKSGPVFLMIGGEAEATAKWMVEGAWIKYAEQFRALCFQVEHRFYGKSRPTSDLSTENLKYLSSEQALADLAFFVEGMKEKYQLSNTTKWIAFGGSYPGSLAAWVREKYPHLIHGSISTSGPLLAKLNFYEYYEVVAESLSSYSDNCVGAVKQATGQIEILLKHMIGQRNLNQKFKLCDPVEKSVDNQLDMANLFENLASNFAGVVQYNKDNSPHAKVTIDEVCDIMTNTTMGAPVDRLAAVNKILLDVNNQTCLDYKYDKMISEMKEIKWDSDVASGSRQWTYQTCAEFGFYQTSDDKNYIFGTRFPVDFFIKQCEDIYGSKFTNETLENYVRRTNVYYGALTLDTTNVIYVHGSVDPWHALGLTHSDNPNMPTIYIKGTAHCANMYEPRSSDPKELIAARKQIVEFIAKLFNN